MLSRNAQEILKLLAIASPRAIEAENLKTQTGLSDVDLEAAASELENLNYVTLGRGGELQGLLLKFSIAFLTSRGAVAADKL